MGESLINKGIINSDQLKQGLEYQNSQDDLGIPILLGEALLHLDFLTRSTLDAAITEQISLLQNALNQSNQNLEARVLKRTEELQTAIEKLTEMNAMKSDFIANISHELRTPLTNMIGYADLLEDGSLGKLNDDQTKAIRVLKKSNLRLSSLIDNLIFISFDSQETLPLQLQDIPIAMMVKNIIESTQEQASEANIDLSVEIEEKLPLATIDLEKIDWALCQIIDNAIKFNQAGGQVVLRARLKQEGISLEVLDTGIGIEADKINDIQEPFVQIDGTSTRRHGGAGLGLSLAKRIIEAHGSTLRIDSNDGQGSKLSFIVPIAKGTP